MKVCTFYAEANLPTRPAQKSAGFDWRQAIRSLSASVRLSLGAETAVITDRATALESSFLRVGDAKAESVVLWLLDAQAAAIRACAGHPLLMVSPDALIAGPLNQLFGDWDVCLLTRATPSPIVNSVIAVQASERLADMWDEIAKDARSLPPAAREWGADLDAVVKAFRITPNDHGLRDERGIRVRLMLLNGIFRSVSAGPVRRLSESIWDFKGNRKKLMPAYAALLPC